MMGLRMLLPPTTPAASTENDPDPVHANPKKLNPKPYQGIIKLYGPDNILQSRIYGGLR